MNLTSINPARVGAAVAVVSALFALVLGAAASLLSSGGA